MIHYLLVASFVACTCKALEFRVSISSDFIVAAAIKAAGLDSSQNKNDEGLNGRVRLYLTRDNSTEPYDSCSDEQSTGQVFGVDVVNFKAGDQVVIDSSVFGYPRESLDDIDAGDYYVQAELFLYDVYKRTGLPEVLFPVTCVSNGGANGEYAKPNGTPFSDVLKVTIPFSKTSRIQIQKEEQSNNNYSIDISLSRVTPSSKSPGCANLGDGVDSEWIKTVRVKSELLSKFWGRDITLEACVLVPLGWDTEEHAQAKYPLVIAHGHYSPVFSPGGEFTETEPTCNPDPAVDGYACVEDMYAYHLYSNWSSYDPKVSAFSGARMIVMTVNHPVPLFDDSYAVNSASLGPYGDAIIRELVPEVEKRYHGIGAGWARALMGGSTGGWESIGVQVLYPDDFNGAYAACPDPVTFTSYSTIDIYNSQNAYFYDAQFKRTERPGQRDDYSGATYPGYGHPYGQTTATIREQNHRELVLGAKSRSCGQWDIWEAVFGPVCNDGYPCRLYDKVTGDINTTVANYWKENFDLRYIMEQNWPILGPKLQGKLHIFVGNSDTYFLTDAVYDMEDFLTTTTNPTSDAEVVIGVHQGRGFEHCFRGYEYDAQGEPLPNSLTRLTYNQAFLPKMADHFVKSAPGGADTTSWRY